MRPLHKFNPVRLQFIRDLAAEHFERDARALRPFEGLTLLDIGCGGGLLSEPMARLGFEVLGADPLEKNVKTAAAHAAGSGLKLDYRATTAEALASEGRAGSTSCSTWKWSSTSPTWRAFFGPARSSIAPGGCMIVATLNRTLKSLALAKIGAEYVLRWLPPGTHDWNRFVTPAELQHHLEDAGLSVTRMQGVEFDPLRWDWRLSSDTDVNYMVVAERLS